MADKKGGKKNRKLGRSIKKCARYRLHQTREKRKIVKVARSSGQKQARKYAAEKGLTDWAEKRLRNFFRRPQPVAVTHVGVIGYTVFYPNA